MRFKLLAPILTLLLALCLLVVAVVAPIRPATPSNDVRQLSVDWKWSDISAGLPVYSLVNGLAVNQHDNRNAYAAAYDTVGFYRTSDGGRTWQPAGRGLEGYAAYAVVIAPDNPQSLLLGTVGGLYRSDDAGVSWQKIWAGENTTRLPASGNAYKVAPLGIFSLVYSPLDSKRIYAGGRGGILVSEDGGASWRFRPVNYPPDWPVPTFLNLAWSRDGRFLYAGTNGAGLLRSSDGGLTWMRVYPTQNIVSAVVVAPDGSIFARAEGQLLRSATNGDSWYDLPGEPYSSFTVVSAGQGMIVYAGANTGGLLESKDGGRSWITAGLAGRRITALAGATDHIYAVTGGGIFVSVGGEWQVAGIGSGRPLIRAVHIDDNDRLYVGTSAGLYSGEAGAWAPVGDVLHDQLIMAMASEPNNPQHLYITPWSGGLYRSNDGGASWQNIAKNQYTLAQMPAFIVDPGEPKTIFARVEYDRIVYTMNGGTTWNPFDQGLQSVTAFSITYDPSMPSTLYIGTDQGIYRSEQGGVWRHLAWGADFDHGSVLALAVDPQNGRKLYAGATNGILISEDGGTTWKQPARGIADVTVSAIAIDPDNPNRIWAGARYSGVYLSEDGGASWSFLGPPTPSPGRGVTVNSLAYDRKHKILYAGTDNGLWEVTRR